MQKDEQIVKKRHAKRQKDETTPCEKTVTRHAKRRNFSAKRRKKPCEKTLSEILNLLSFRVASLRMASLHLYVFSSGVFLPREIAEINHHRFM